MKNTLQFNISQTIYYIKVIQSRTWRIHLQQFFKYLDSEKPRICVVSHFRNLENTQKKIVTHRLHQWSIIQTLFTLSAVSLFVLLYNTERKMTDRYSSLRSICPSFLFTFIKNIMNFEANSLFFEPHHQLPLMHRSSFSLFQIYHLE